jgi:hypothetical protein
MASIFVPKLTLNLEVGRREDSQNQPKEHTKKKC